MSTAICMGYGSLIRSGKIVFKCFYKGEYKQLTGETVGCFFVEKENINETCTAAK